MTSRPTLCRLQQPGGATYQGGSSTGMTELGTELSVIIPCYNEEEVLPILLGRLTAALVGLRITFEVIFVDDGSTDRTFEILSEFHRSDRRFKVVRFSRNFGHQAAVAAGLFYTNGAAAAVMDADLQDPPELLAQCIEKWRTGYEVVYAVRRSRREGLLRRLAYIAYYRLLRVVADINIPLDSGDFCLMDRRVVDVLREMRERNIFVRGLRAWAGFRQVGLEYDRDERAAGTTKYPFRKLHRLATDGIFAFSTFPLRLATWLGFVTVGLGVLLALFILVWRMVGFRFMGHTGAEVPGWSAIIIGMLFFGGVQLVVLGIIGEYVGRIYTEAKARPRWIVQKALGIDDLPRTVAESREFAE
jgi:polyisoprenyl-phosphate glycosyltransferase